MTNMSAVASETFGPNREAMSSGGTAEATFHVTMCTLEEDRKEGNAASDPGSTAGSKREACELQSSEDQHRCCVERK